MQNDTDKFWNRDDTEGLQINKRKIYEWYKCKKGNNSVDML